MEFPKRILEHWPDSGDGMEFKLVFKGTLPSERRAGVEIKHNVRRVLHPQLRTLWQQDPALRGAFDPKLNMRTKGQLSRVEELATDNAKYGFRFVPLVKKNDFACALDITLLLRKEPFRVFEAKERHDLDNRIKTLVDGLRMPDQSSEITGESPSMDENPFFVLMDDDSAIFEFQVRAQRLLIPPDAGESERDVIALIGVRVTTLAGNPIAYMCGEF